MLIEVMLVLLLVSITCCSLLTGYKACVLAMQQYNRLELAFELLEVRNVEAADALAAEQGLFIERKEFIDNLQIKQEIITVRECRNQRCLLIRCVMHCRNKGFLLVELNLALIFIITTSLLFAGGGDSCCRAGSVYSLTLCCGGLQITVSHYLRENCFYMQQQ